MSDGVLEAVGAVVLARLGRRRSARSRTLVELTRAAPDVPGLLQPALLASRLGRVDEALRPTQQVLSLVRGPGAEVVEALEPPQVRASRASAEASLHGRGRAS